MGERSVRIRKVMGSTPTGSTKKPLQRMPGRFCYEWESKDERHRATVRWTVVTASDQAPAGARIDSHRVHQKAASAYAEAAFFLFMLSDKLLIVVALILKIFIYVIT